MFSLAYEDEVAARCLYPVAFSGHQLRGAGRQGRDRERESCTSEPYVRASRTRTYDSPNTGT